MNPKLDSKIPPQTRLRDAEDNDLPPRLLTGMGFFSPCRRRRHKERKTHTCKPPGSHKQLVKVKRVDQGIESVFPFIIGSEQEGVHDY